MSSCVVDEAICKDALLISFLKIHDFTKHNQVAIFKMASYEDLVVY